jgi:condensation domain-containing protein
MSDITKRIGELPPEERRELLARLLRERARQKPKTAPLSFSQERLYFLERLYPGSSVYNIPMPVGLPGPLNADVLKRSLNEMARRHEVLRTTFTSVEGKPVQVIAPTPNVELPVTDLSSLEPAARYAEAGRLAHEDARRPFDLAQGPLFRAALVRLAEQEHHLLLSMHHIISDGWSMGIFFRELWTIYQAFLAGQPSPLPELQMQYADFATQQRKELQGAAYTALCDYWKRQLGGAPQLLSLSISKPRPPLQTYRGSNIAFSISRSVSEALRAISKKENATLFMTLLAGFAVLLHRSSRRTDIVVGTPIAGRSRAAIEGLIGFFVNSLVLRVDLGGDPTFRELVGRVRAVTLGAYENQDLPFEKLVEELQPERNPSHAPLAQIFFTWQNVPTTGQSAGGPPPLSSDAEEEDPELDNAPPEIGTSKFDMQLTMGEVGQAISGGLEYNIDLFDHTDIRDLVGRFRTLLRDVVMNPDRPISSLHLLTATQTSGLSPADFPDAGLTQEDFEDLVSALRSIA